ncbi:uncharacterized protein LOC120134737 [Hibiscus syriacus]|uniref:uncharacterized protein LOC120134737 n=1 Tax=Hibiscus syriacus TaxID=106335 RepID=UPI001923BDF2|nr:uncharacterized protein LOC120134737 [Hibiscus syriacus]
MELIQQITGFQPGTLPVRYLGVPLTSRKLSMKDYDPLIDSIKSKLSIWSCKYLSYAERLELIRAVLFSIANYWCRQFLLPHSVISKIEQLCCRFFWKGNDKSATSARAYVLKGKELWQMEAGPSLSWSFRKILKLRIEAHPILHNGALSVRQIWKEIRMKEDKVPWHSLIWFPQNIPKLSLIAWMAMIDRLPTCDRIQRMGIVSIGSCVLCNDTLENRNHLFFECPIATQLRVQTLLLNGINKTISSWEDMISWASCTWKGKSLLITILKLAWSATIYVLWEERNRRIFKGCSRNTAELLSSIKDYVGIKLRGGNINRLDYVNSIQSLHCLGY